jgi:hypothetical protein
MDVETTTQQLADELMARLDEVTIEQIEQDAEGTAAAIFALLCPHCARRRKGQGFSDAPVAL